MCIYAYIYVYNILVNKQAHRCTPYYKQMLSLADEHMGGDGLAGNAERRSDAGPANMLPVVVSTLDAQRDVLRSVAGSLWEGAYDWVCAWSLHVWSKHV